MWRKNANNNCFPSRYCSTYCRNLKLEQFVSNIAIPSGRLRFVDGKHGFSAVHFIVLKKNCPKFSTNSYRIIYIKFMTVPSAYTYQLNVISTKFQIKNEIILENGIFSPWKMWLVKWALLLYVYVFDIKPRPHVRRKSFHYHFDTYFSSSTYCTYTIKCHQSSPLRR